MNQLIAKTNVQNKRSRVEHKVEQKYMIIKYANQNPKLKQTQLIEHFSRLFQVNIPKTTMSGILSVCCTRVLDAKALRTRWQPRELTVHACTPHPRIYI